MIDCMSQGSNLVFEDNFCSGGHGISIGSVSADATVKNIQVLNNKIVNNDQALRIKTKADAANASVTNVVFNGNTATGIKKYGVIVDQSYPTTLGTLTNTLHPCHGWDTLTGEGEGGHSDTRGSTLVIP